MTRYLLDTGPWIAYGDASDQHHAWAKQLFQQITPPLFTCEPVLAEMCFLARRAGGEPAVILGMVETGVFQVAFHLGEEVARVCELMQRYRDVPMSLADACLVRMAECFSDGVKAAHFCWYAKFQLGIFISCC